MTGRAIVYGFVLSAPFWAMALLGFAVGRATA